MQSRQGSRSSDPPLCRKSEQSPSVRKSQVLEYVGSYLVIVYGVDPTTNPRLAALVTIAKKSGLPKTTLEGAIARGARKSLSGVALETISVEAMMPLSVAAIIECQTDNKLRTLSDIRCVIKHYGGTVTPTNHLFERLGKTILEGTEGVREEDIFDQAIECGATDVEITEDRKFVIYTGPQQTASVAETLANITGLQILSSDIVWSPKAETKIEETLDGALEGFVGIDILPRTENVELTEA